MFDATQFPSVNLDSTLENSDWTKQTWDLPTTLEGCKKAGVDLAEIDTLPAGRAMPDSLRREWEASKRSSARRNQTKMETGRG